MLADENVTLFNILYSIEILCIIAPMFMCSITAWTVLEAPLLHANFVRLYKFVYLELILFSIARLIQVVAILAQISNARVDEIYIENGPTSLLICGFFGWVQIARLGILFCCAVCYFYILIERILATIMLKNYETSRGYLVSIFLIIGHINTSLVLLVLYFMDRIPFLVLAVGGGLVLFFCTLAILLLKKYNMQQYRKSKLDNSEYTLSEKFQISENVRSLEILWKSYVYAIAFIIIIVCFFLLTFFVKIPLLKRLLFVAFNYTIPIYSCMAAYIFVTSNHIWRRSLKNKLFSVKKRLNSARISVDKDRQRKFTNERLDHLKTLDGQKMVYTIDEEGELYFIQLRKEWDRVRTKNI